MGGTLIGPNRHPVTVQVEGGRGAPGPLSASPPAEVVDRARGAAHLVILLDYDGTLVPFETMPDLACPDPDLVDLLRRLSARPRTEVHLVSGRKRATLERWFGTLTVGLHAEHGLWSRNGAAWQCVEVNDTRWREPALNILREFTERVPGALVEEKTAGVAWHYRAADPEPAAVQARELCRHLSALVTSAPVEILQGDRVVELRPRGVHKGRVARLVLDRAPPASVALAIGDDRTDEDLFEALPQGSIAVHVGAGESRAGLRVDHVEDVRRLLAEIVRHDSERHACTPSSPW
jgi:trehalose 6-phosphate synthase/phosphatase